MRNSGSIKTLLVLVVVALLIVGSVLGCVADYLHTVSVVGTVTDKDRIVTSDSSYYLVWIEDDAGVIHVFKNEDSIMHGKFNSSTIQGQFRVGNRVNVSGNGYRIPFMSAYPNVLEVTIINGVEEAEEE